MEQKDLRNWEARCTQEEPPPCRAGCPLNVDSRAFVLAMSKGDIGGARNILEKSMPLTGIVGRMCEAPCEQFCLRGDLGGALSLGLLERSCVASESVKKKLLRLPARPKKIAVIGGGPSGLTVAFDMGKKGYSVDLYHRGAVPGAWLNDVASDVLPKEVLEEELKRLESLKVSFISSAVLGRSLIDEKSYDAFYVGGDDSIDQSLLEIVAEPDMRTFAVAQEGWFSGGLNSGDDPFRFISDVSQGREAAVSIDRFLQGASLTASRLELRNGETTLFTNTDDVTSRDRLVPSGKNMFSTDEAIEEAGRCLDCQCLECVKQCVYLAEHGGYPKIYARRIYNNSAIVKGIHQANKFINSCSLCDQCKTICPNDFSMSELCIEARRLMVNEQRMPPSAYWFALEEMRSARTEGAFVNHAPGTTASKILFFPGCQLAGIRPEQTIRLYDHLLGLEVETGIWLDCCGVPSDWAGHQDEHGDICRQLEKVWGSMGEPLILTGCSSCLKMFRDYLPGIRVRSVWSMLVNSKFNTKKRYSPSAVSDPCSARLDETTRSDVRELLEKVGQPLSALKMSGELTECCGFGGLMESVNPALARQVASSRAEQTGDKIITYCAMCRDQLAKVEKPVVHILDILFPETAHPADEPPASISVRRINRRNLKAELIDRFPGADKPSAEPWEGLLLEISDHVEVLMEERRILEDDIRRVLFYAGESGKCLVYGDGQTMIASARLGEVTFWVKYQHLDNKHHIVGCWSHRMQLKGETL